MVKVGQQLLQPENGWRRYDSNTPLIKYNGNWISHTNSGYYNGSNMATTSKGSIELCFYGTKIRILGYSDPVRSDLVSIKINNETTDSFTMSATGDNSVFQTIYYEKENLEKKIHKIVIEDIGTRFSLDLDAIDIDADGELIRHDYLENAHLDEPLRRYGIAHFGFDEASGNVYDKLGSDYVGAVTGATRVSGWNGEGKAIYINGVQQVLFNSGITTMEEFTIRLKIKIKSANKVGYLLTTQAVGSSDKGIRLEINTNRELSFVSGNGSYISSATSKPLELGTWYDVIVNISNKTKSTYFFINEELVSYQKITTDYLGNGTAMLLGRVVTSNTTNTVDCELDDLQVYSKALILDDFVQKRVAIKTADNKNLVLSTESGRVKEIPSTDKTDLINQGYAWKEIDNAVDTTGIDLTQPTTEYEVVSKTNTVLGAGKMFIIPLPAEFKTVIIEDND